MLDHDRACLDRAWTIIYRLICLLQVRLPNLWSGPKDQWHLLHLTRVAESMVRRWLVLKACVDGERPNVTASKTSQKPASPSRPPSHSQGPVRLPITEPDPCAPVFIYHPAQDGEPGHYVLTHRTGTGLPADGALPSALNRATLKSRIEGLISVISAPGPHVTRMARWLARAVARRKCGPCKLHPFRVGWPPGASKRQRRLDPERQDMLLYLDQLAREAVLRAVPP